MDRVLWGVSMKCLWQILVALGQQTGCFHVPAPLQVITIFNKCHEVKGWETLSNSTCSHWLPSWPSLLLFKWACSIASCWLFPLPRMPPFFLCWLPLNSWGKPVHFYGTPSPFSEELLHWQRTLHSEIKVRLHSFTDSFCALVAVNSHN